jgi:7-cyano-7-deazaguanine synthase
MVILSGGQDSTTCLFWAKHKIPGPLHAITFNYGQRHDREIESARYLARMAGVSSHEVLSLDGAVGERIEFGCPTERLPILSGRSPLVNRSAQVGHYSSIKDLPGGVEPTFVPGRNALFLVLAANRAMMLPGAEEGIILITGVCEEDFGGYPDCRQRFIDSMAMSLTEALYIDGENAGVTILTPLMHLNKCETVKLATTLPGCMTALAYTHTCYDGEYPPNPSNHASLLRARGFAEAGVADPLIVRAKQAGLLPSDYPDSGLVEGKAQ